MSGDEAWLKDMVAAAREALERARDLDYEAFKANRGEQLAIMHLIVIIGEAASQVTPVTRERLPAVPWRQVVGMRNRLVHHYFKARLDLVWEVIADHLRPLLDAVEPYLEQRPPEPDTTT